MNSKINPERLPDAWGGRIARVTTVWGLGMGTGVALCLYAWLVVRMGGGHFALVCTLCAALGMMLAAGLAYLQYVQGHLRIVFTSDVRHGSWIAATIGATVLFISAALVVLLSAPVLIGFALYVEAVKRTGQVMTLRQKTDTYFAGLVPQLNVF